MHDVTLNLGLATVRCDGAVCYLLSFVHLSFIKKVSWQFWVRKKTEIGELHCGRKWRNDNLDLEDLRIELDHSLVPPSHSSTHCRLREAQQSQADQMWPRRKRSDLMAHLAPSVRTGPRVARDPAPAPAPVKAGLSAVFDYVRNPESTTLTVLCHSIAVFELWT